MFVCLPAHITKNFTFVVSYECICHLLTSGKTNKFIYFSNSSKKCSLSLGVRIKYFDVRTEHCMLGSFLVINIKIVFLFEDLEISLSRTENNDYFKKNEQKLKIILKMSL